MMRLLLPALALLLALPAAAAPAKIAPPVAVMPFKNLNDDAATDWLKLGIAETMLSDLRKAGTTVVERDQLDKALSEILLQGQSGTDEGEAVKVGRLVGAKTVVLGSFQAAGKQLRITARFVEVETGVVLDSAKTTGPKETVFALQDEIVAKLLGKPPARPAPKKGTKTVEAYRLYAMSLSVASDAEKVGLLKKSLALDPSFVYAADELAALEKRLKEYAKARETASTALDATTFALLADPKVPVQEKQWRAGQLLTRHLGERRCQAAVSEAKRVLELGIPDPEPGIVGANESALNTMVVCYRMLQQPDLAIQAGEALLKRFPAGAWYKTTERTVQEILEHRRKAPERAAKIDAKFAQLEEEAKKDEAERASTLERLREVEAALARPLEHAYQKTMLEARRDDLRRRLEGLDAGARGRDLARCWFPAGLDPQRTLDGCRAFLARYASDPAAAGDRRRAREEEIEALGELGRWEEAIPAARAFVAEHPDSNLKSLLQWSWPADAAP